nr:MAG TPA: hypothetical protein [Bacteriophage sp.]
MWFISFLKRVFSNISGLLFSCHYLSIAIPIKIYYMFHIT